jgi:hypothetical protein
MMPLMATQLYDWKRFWCLREDTINLSDGGYLVDPETATEKLYNPRLVSSDDLREKTCVILLGEPGTGKTHSIAEMQTHDQETSKETGHQVLTFDLRAYGSEDRLVRDIFCNDVIKSWTGGSGVLHLYLDSLDECLLRIDSLAALLGQELAKLPVDRLKLRIACRTAEWPKLLEVDLVKAFGGGDSVRVYELAPLRRTDVERSAVVNGFDAPEFMHEIERVHAAALAIKPVTLNFLLNTYRKSNHLPADQAQLYFDGCRILCEETRNLPHAHRLTADQRLAVAMRIAAVTIFSNWYAVWTGIDLGDVPDVDVMIRDIAGGYENVKTDKFLATEASVRETLGTGLFSSRGVDRMGWAHQTYAEYLAARYVYEKDVAIDQIKSLLIHAGVVEERVVPQLSETAAWVANLVPAFFDEVAKRDPEVLLRSAVSRSLTGNKEKLVSAILEMSANDKIVPVNLVVQSDLSGLRHPTIADQLRPYLAPTGQTNSVMHAAIDIAQACRVVELSTDLANLALNAASPLAIRINAACAVAVMGDDVSKSSLKPLATEEQDADTDDELKGFALQALWPQSLSAVEVFSVLKRRKSNLYGSYFRFLVADLPKQIRASDLPAALDWLEKRAGNSFSDTTLMALDHAIMYAALENIETAEVADRLARIILRRFRQYHEIYYGAGRSEVKAFEETIGKDASKRHLLFSAMVPYLTNPDSDRYFLANCSPRLATHADFDWLSGQIKASSDELTKRLLVKTLESIADYRDRRHIDSILVQCEADLLMADVFSPYIKPIDLGSPLAESLKAQLEEAKRFENQRHTIPAVDPPPRERVQRLLKMSEEGQQNVWWQLCRELSLEAKSTYYGSDFSSDITKLPGWNDADSGTRGRIVDAARRFITEGQPQISEWLGTGQYYLADLSGYQALYLLLKEAPIEFSSIDSRIWEKWAPIVLSFPHVNISEDIPAQIAKSAYEHAPNETLSALQVLMDAELVKTESVYAIQRLVPLWDDRIAQAVFLKLKDPTLSSSAFGSLLEILVMQGDKEGRALAESMMSGELVSSPDSRPRAIVAGKILLHHEGQAGWRAVWPVIDREEEFGRAVLEDISFPPDPKSNFLNHLTENDLGVLFVWLARHYSYGDEVTGRSYAGAVGPMHTIRILRDSTLTTLIRRGTHESAGALASAMRQLPEYPWLKYQLLEAQAATRAKTWVAPRPGDVLSLGANREARLVQSGTELLGAIIDSLKRLEEKLHGESNAVQFIWDKRDKVFRPRDEDSLSDFIKLHLEEDLKNRGIIINREVRIHRGQRTDIHVDAVSEGAVEGQFDIIAAILEMKGSWNPELDSAMESQLIGKYLRDNNCRHGLYLVGWFTSDLWDSKDHRSRQVPSESISEARKRFDHQAAALSDSDDITVRAFVLDAKLLEPTAIRTVDPSQATDPKKPETGNT